MLKPLHMQAEPYVPTGNIASEGMRNQLGRPRIDRLTLLVRESVQNAWDARAPGSSTVRFGVTGRDLLDAQRLLLRDVVFHEAPPKSAIPKSEVEKLGQVVEHPRDVATSRDGVQMLFVYDRGTTGLGGPTRADEFGSADEARDFVDFFRNVGTPPDTAQGGGTFGYGKAALYLASAAQTILVHTRARVRGEFVSRFMVSTLTDHYAHANRLHTGRHWWGRKASDGVVDPVLGAEADEFARALGFPAMEWNECGTTIGILAPDFSTRNGDPADAIDYASWQIVHNFWPKMFAWPNEPEPRMRFESGWNDVVTPLPDPAEVHPYADFAASLSKVRKSEIEGGEDEQIFCLRPKKLLGRVAITKCMAHESPLARWLPDDEMSRRVHHVALLRRPELVVTYHHGPPLPLDQMGYAGVFLADSALDRVYAGAEPPTHDAWNPEILNEPSARTFVRTTFKRLQEKLGEVVRPFEAGPAKQKPGAKLTRIADRLGSVLIGVEGDGPSLQPEPEEGKKKKRSGKKVRARKGSARLQNKSRLRVRGSDLIRAFDFDVSHAEGRSSTRVRAEAASVLLGGGIEREPPAGAVTVRVVGWTSPTGREWTDGDEIDLDEEGAWSIDVAVPRDASVSLKLTVLDGAS